MATGLGKGDAYRNLLIQMLISYGDPPRTKVSPAFWTSLSPVKVTQDSPSQGVTSEILCVKPGGIFSACTKNKSQREIIPHWFLVFHKAGRKRKKKRPPIQEFITQVFVAKFGVWHPINCVICKISHWEFSLKEAEFVVTKFPLQKQKQIPIEKTLFESNLKRTLVGKDQNIISQ